MNEPQLYYPTFYFYGNLPDRHILTPDYEMLRKMFENSAWTEEISKATMTEIVGEQPLPDDPYDM